MKNIGKFITKITQILYMSTQNKAPQNRVHVLWNALDTHVSWKIDASIYDIISAGIFVSYENRPTGKTQHILLISDVRFHKYQ